MVWYTGLCQLLGFAEMGIYRDWCVGDRRSYYPDKLRYVSGTTHGSQCMGYITWGQYHYGYALYSIMLLFATSRFRLAATPALYPLLGGLIIIRGIQSMGRTLHSTGYTSLRHGSGLPPIPSRTYPVAVSAFILSGSQASFCRGRAPRPTRFRLSVSDSAFTVLSRLCRPRASRSHRACAGLGLHGPIAPVPA